MAARVSFSWDSEYNLVCKALRSEVADVEELGGWSNETATACGELADIRRAVEGTCIGAGAGGGGDATRGNDVSHEVSEVFVEKLRASKLAYSY